MCMFFIVVCCVFGRTLFNCLLFVVQRIGPKQQQCMGSAKEQRLSRTDSKLNQVQRTVQHAASDLKFNCEWHMQCQHELCAPHVESLLLPLVPHSHAGSRLSI